MTVGFSKFVEFETELQRPNLGTLSEDEIQEMLVLATRIRKQAGAELDDDAILAVAEATGTSVDYVRLAVRSIPVEERKETMIDRLKRSFLAFSSDHRRLVMASVLGLAAGVMMFWGEALRRDVSGLFETLGFIAYAGGIVNAAVSRSMKIAMGSGALLGALSMLTISLFGFVAGLILPSIQIGAGVGYFVLATLLGTIISAISFSAFSKNRSRMGFGDPVAERHALIQQMMEIQSQLKSDEKNVTFLSVDAVGSTKLKTKNDPISVEFTFNEYHNFVESIVRKHGGRIHSTAGDGVTAVFEDPQLAFTAGRALQSGLFEFNQFRNKLHEDLQLRAGIHTGNILAPGKDSTSVNFAHVIDIAAHMQKEAPIGGLLVSEQTAMYFGGLKSVSEVVVTVDEFRAAVWQPRSRNIIARLPQDMN